MNKYSYLIIGGGIAADAASRGIREIDSTGSIAILTAETDPPYWRPLLSKDLWYDPSAINKLDCNTERVSNLAIITGRRVARIDPSQQVVTDQEGHEYLYDRLLIATGGRPRKLRLNGQPVMYYRSFADYRIVRATLPKCRRVAVIGGGFIGCEMAAAMISQQKEVFLIFPEETLGGGRFPPTVSKALNAYYEERGVKLYPGQKVTRIDAHENRYETRLETEESVSVDYVIAGIGIKPNCELAEDAGLEIGDGIIVNEWLQTSDPNIYAAGDVASFLNPTLDKRMRVEHEDNAVEMGKTAGRNLAGAKEAYTYLPYFYSDLFEVGYEAIGEMNSSAETVSIWNGLHEPGIWAYTEEGRVRGLLLWNLFGQHEAGRKWIAEGRSLSAEQIKERLQTILREGDDN
jgi:3-phenylpropionate/trans-cinnamate dioxygenase ferredoxin reductase component